MHQLKKRSIERFFALCARQGQFNWYMMASHKLMEARQSGCAYLIVHLRNQTIMNLQTARILIAVMAAISIPALADNVAVVNGKPISSATIDSMVKAQGTRGQRDTPELRAQLKEQLINIQLLAQEGTRLGLDKKAETKNEIELARSEIVARTFVNDFAKKNQPTDAEIKTEYEKYKSQLADTKEYRAHQLVFDKEDEAKDVISKLKGGAKFEDMAKRSKDSSAQANGGELDWSLPAKYPKPFADALIALQKGQITDTPVKTQFGYHVIRLDDIRPTKIATLEEIKPTISSWLTQQKLLAFQQDLRKKASIK
jgi:peptidyl-prolyl cis-trans isomerase C